MQQDDRIYEDSGYWRVHTEISIDAPPPDVWEVVMDGIHMRNWATRGLIYHGPKAVDGALLRIKLQLGPKPAVVSLVRQIELEENKLLGWDGKIVSGFADNHRIELHSERDGTLTRVVQSDLLRGGLGTRVSKQAMQIYLGAYSTWNEELRTEVGRRRRASTDDPDRRSVS